MSNQRITSFNWTSTLTLNYFHTSSVIQTKFCHSYFEYIGQQIIFLSHPTKIADWLTLINLHVSHIPSAIESHFLIIAMPVISPSIKKAKSCSSVSQPASYLTSWIVSKHSDIFTFSHMSSLFFPFTVTECQIFSHHHNLARCFFNHHQIVYSRSILLSSFNSSIYFSSDWSILWFNLILSYVIQLLKESLK